MNPVIRALKAGRQTEPLITGWPEGLEFNRENLRRIAREYDVYYEGINILPEPDEDDWREVDQSKNGRSTKRPDTQKIFKFRALCQENTYCKRALKLYKIYVFGSDFTPTLEARDPTMSREERLKHQMKAAELWEQLLEFNHDAWSPEEHGKRAWREGDAITWATKVGDNLALRFIDPEDLNHPEHPDWNGIETDPNDATQRYTYYVSYNGIQVDFEVPAEDIYHTRLDADAVESRGYSRFEPVIKPSRFIDALIETETYHRQLQASIVLVRKVAGGKGTAQILLDNNKTGTRQYADGSTMSMEKLRKGSILTTPTGVEYEFKQPSSNFSDATPLVNMLIRQVSVATGWPFSMLSADSSEGTLASEIANESPVGQMVADERKDLSVPIKAIFKRLLTLKINEFEGFSSIEELLKKFKISMKYGLNAQRDPLKFAQALNIPVMQGAMSRRQMSRMLELDPDQMQEEVKQEVESGLYGANGTQMPTAQDSAKSSQNNAQGGSGGNQGTAQPISHKDSNT